MYYRITLLIEEKFTPAEYNPHKMGASFSVDKFKSTIILLQEQSAWGHLD